MRGRRSFLAGERIAGQFRAEFFNIFNRPNFSLPSGTVFNADTLGYSNMPCVSGAGHDAVYMARLAPAGMIFIPCKDGISHNEIEDAKPEHITAGCNVLLHAMLERAGVAS